MQIRVTLIQGRNTMVNFQNEPINRAVEQSQYSKEKLAVLAEVATPTLEKVMNGEANLMLDSVERIADYLGYDVVISFKKKLPAKAPALAGV